MGILAALQFLTIIPIRRGFTSETVARSTGYFPLVGLIIGIILAGLNYALGFILPSGVVNVLLIVALAVLSGAMHLDGLIDTCDGLAAHKTPEERWQVMHDSRAGGFGVIGAILLLLVKYVALNNVPQNWMMYTLLLAPVLSRWTMVYAIFAYPYARPAGLGKAFKEGVSWRQFLVATLIALAAAGALFKLAGVVIFSVIWLIAIAVAHYLRRQFAGLTGDTYGAINEIAETGVFILVNLLVYNQWMYQWL